MTFNRDRKAVEYLSTSCFASASTLAFVFQHSLIHLCSFVPRPVQNTNSVSDRTNPGSLTLNKMKNCVTMQPQ